MLQDESISILGFASGVSANSPLGGPKEIELASTGIKSASNIKTCFGNRSDPLGVITVDGKVFTFAASNDKPYVTLQHEGGHDVPQITAIAVAESNKTAVVVLAAPEAKVMHILEFQSFQLFLAWYAEPSSDGTRTFLQYSAEGRAAEMVAGQTSFAVRTEEGGIYTFGDPRQPALLGRTSTEEQPADKPALVELAEPVKFTRIDSGTFWFAALSESKDVYTWGSGRPGQSLGMQAILPRSSALPEPVDFRSGELDNVAAVGAGGGHMLVLTQDGKVFGTGDNGNSQLGFVDADKEEHAAEWRRLQDVWAEEGSTVVDVKCGDLTSFVVVRRKDA